MVSEDSLIIFYGSYHTLVMPDACCHWNTLAINIISLCKSLQPRIQYRQRIEWCQHPACVRHGPQREDRSFFRGYCSISNFRQPSMVTDCNHLHLLPLKQGGVLSGSPDNCAQRRAKIRLSEAYGTSKSPKFASVCTQLNLFKTAVQNSSFTF